MSIVQEGSVLHLQGVCRVEEAEAIAALLQTGGVTLVDLSACEGLHSAVVQALMVFAAPIRGEAIDPFIRTWVTPALTAQTAASAHVIDQPKMPLEEGD